MRISSTDSCTISCIHGITYENPQDPVKLMQEFCQKVGQKKLDPVTKKFDGLRILPVAFYMFNTVVRQTSCIYYGKPAREIGLKLAALIRKEGLGPITETVERNNPACHTNNYSKVWVWSPDGPALEAWYKKSLEPEYKPPSLDLSLTNIKMLQNYPAYTALSPRLRARVRAVVRTKKLNTSDEKVVASVIDNILKLKKG